MSDLARIDQSPDRLPADDQFRLQFQRMEAECKVMARSRLVPDAYRLDRDRHPRPADEITADIMMVALDCSKRGIPFSLTTLTKYAIVNGAAFPMGQILIGLVARHGHDLWIEERTPESVTVVLLNCRTNREHRSTYTLAEAKATSSYKKNVALGADRSVWLSHPTDMLTWRAVNRAVRIGAPDIAAGFGFEEPVEWVDVPQRLPEPPLAVPEAPLALDAVLGGPEAPKPAPATDEVKKRLAAAIQSLTPEQRSWLVERWQAMELPPLTHADFDTTDAVDASQLVLEAMAAPVDSTPIQTGSPAGTGAPEPTPAPGEGAEASSKAPDPGHDDEPQYDQGQAFED